MTLISIRHYTAHYHQSIHHTLPHSPSWCCTCVCGVLSLTPFQSPFEYDGVWERGGGWAFFFFFSLLSCFLESNITQPIYLAAISDKCCIHPFDILARFCSASLDECVRYSNVLQSCVAQLIEIKKDNCTEREKRKQ